MANIIEITDIHAPELDIFMRKSENQLLHWNEPDEVGIFVAESPLVIGRALDAGYEPIAALVETKELENQAREVLERCGDIPIYTVDANVRKELTGIPMTRGLLCVMKRKKLEDVSAICKNARRIAILDNVENPTNIGAIFRSAAALNMDAVILTSDCSNPLFRRASRVSMGTVFQIPWTMVKKNEDIIANIQKLGFEAVAMALKEDTLDIDDSHLAQISKLAIVMGNEGDGLTDETIGKCDYTVKIPMAHGVDSLNVAAASAVAFWQMGKNKPE